MRKAVVVSATDGDKRLTFTVINKNDEILIGHVKWFFFNDETDKSAIKLDMTAECYERRAGARAHGFTEKFFTDPSEYIWHFEERQNECIREVVKKAMPDVKVVRIINI